MTKHKSIDYFPIQGFSFSSYMRITSEAIAAMLFAALVFVSPYAQAQSTIYLSNLGGDPANYAGYGVGNDQWLANSFETGTSSAGYQLNSIQLPIGVNGNPSGFSLFLYNDNNGQPGSNIGSLNGPDPTDWALYTYTATSISLTPSTLYWIVATSPTPAYSDDSFYWVITSSTSYVSSDDWSMNPGFWCMGDGSAWGNGTGSPFQFEVSATPAPEPEIYSLMGLGLAAVFLRRRK